MIASIQGKVIHTGSLSLVVLVGGVGVEVLVPHSTLERISGGDIFLHTRLIVREDALSLYGFNTESERELFDILLKVNGVGPRLALAILSTMSIDNLRNAVMSERAELLTRVPGIGKKTAQKIVLELKDKLKFGLEAMPAELGDDLNTDVMDALTALGYSVIEAQMAVQSLPSSAPKDIEERIRLALQYFS